MTTRRITRRKKKLRPGVQKLLDGLMRRREILKRHGLLDEGRDYSKIGQPTKRGRGRPPKQIRMEDLEGPSPEELAAEEQEEEE